MTTSGETATDTAGIPAESDVDAAALGPSRTDEWLAMLTDTTAPTMRPDLFGAAFSAIAWIVGEDSEAKQTVGRLIERRVAGAGPDSALAEMTDGLQNYLGIDGAYLVHWLAYHETTERLNRVQAVAPAPVIVFLRAVLAEHGRTLDILQRAAMSGMRDWSSIDKRAFVDTLTGRQIFAITFFTYDGSSLRLECSPDSLMNLASHLLELVNAPRSMRGYSPSLLQRFTDQLQESIVLLNEANEEITEEGTSDPSSTADTDDQR